MSEELIDFKISAIEKNVEKVESRVKSNENEIVTIRLQIKDLKIIRQIVFGLVGLALLSVWDKLGI